MSIELFKLLAQRDLTNVAGRGTIVNSLLRPMSLELNSAQKLVMQMRRKQMVELIERESREQILELKNRNILLKTTKVCRYRRTPLGMMPARH